MTRLQALLLSIVAPTVALPTDIPPPRPAPTTAEVEHRLARGKGFANQGDVDLFIAATRTWTLRQEDERLWQSAVEMGQNAVKKAGITGDHLPRGPALAADFSDYCSQMHPVLNRIDGVYRRPENDVQLAPARVNPEEAIMAAAVESPQWIRGLVVSRGSVSAKGPINDSLILANGSVTTGDKLNGSVVISDGDVIVKNSVGAGSLIIARGRIDIGRSASLCTLIAGNTVTIGKPRPPLQGIEAFVNPIIRTKVTKPLRYIRFFELSRLGVEIDFTSGPARVVAVAPEKPFGKAGIRPGDTVERINGKRANSVESLRRLLRDALAVGDAEVTFLRNDKSRSVPVSLGE